MKSILFVCILSAGLAILPPIYAASPHGKKVKPKAARPSVSLNAWHSNPALIGELEPETQIGGYAMRLPVEYHEVAVPNADRARAQGFDNHVYAHDRFPDGTASMITITIATPPPNVTDIPTLEEALEGVVAQKQKTWGDFTESPVERGKIGTMTFARAYFKGTLTNAVGTRSVHGLAYATVDGRKIVAFQAEAAEPHSQTALPIFDTSILTFHKP